MVLYGMISAVGVRNVVENQVDFTNSRNVIIAALIMVLAIGITYSEAGAILTVGGATISLSGLAVAAIAGIVLNAILPGKDYEFGEDEQGRHLGQLQGLILRVPSIEPAFGPALQAPGLFHLKSGVIQ